MNPAKTQTFKASQWLEESQLCVCCVSPNETSAHFCSKCGAPLSSYAATGPFECLFAEGYVYRQAAQRPRSLIVVVGVWLIFGPLALAGLISVFAGNRVDAISGAGVGLLILPISVAMIWKTTRNYLARKPTNPKSDI
ncbi:MAG: zinc ribbon domain-containing protein [Pedosphaera sp.]|nr:zinc ribbon domain-containing protein [Pedosphaera sp.]